MHVLGVFLLELATVWLALVVLARLSGWSIRQHVHHRAFTGVGDAGVVVALPASTLDASSPFVCNVLAVAIGAAPIRLERHGRRRWQIFTTALVAVTLTTVAYAGAYLLL